MSNNYFVVELKPSDLEIILEIENRVHSHPWTRGNFVDSFFSGHVAIGIKNNTGQVIAYCVLMPVLEEFHLLTFAVDVPFQKQGYAKLLLEAMCDYVRSHAADSILLEVRVSNSRAQHVYAAYGFSEIGRRKSYYPLHDTGREDAIVMRLSIET